MLSRIRANRRHTRLMRIASTLVDRKDVGAVSDFTTIRPGDITRLAFGMHQLHVTDDEATTYLNAALVRVGQPPTA